MTLRPGLFLAVGTTLAVPVRTAAQSAILQGTVRDAEHGTPVAGARVALGAWLGGWTGLDGRFQFSVPLGRYAPVVDCPRRHDNPLAAGADSIVVSGPSADIDLTLAHGAECLTPMSATSYGEFRGVLLAGGSVRLLQLCGSPNYRVAIDFPPAAWRDLVFKATRSEDARHPDLALSVRGRLSGPGFFGADGSAGYLIEVEKVISFQRRTPAESCR